MAYETAVVTTFIEARNAERVGRPAGEECPGRGDDDAGERMPGLVGDIHGQDAAAEIATALEHSCCENIARRVRRYAISNNISSSGGCHGP